MPLPGGGPVNLIEAVRVEPRGIAMYRVRCTQSQVRGIGAAYRKHFPERPGFLKPSAKQMFANPRFAADVFPLFDHATGAKIRELIEWYGPRLQLFFEWGGFIS